MGLHAVTNVCFTDTVPRSSLLETATENMSKVIEQSKRQKMHLLIMQNTMLWRVSNICRPYVFSIHLFSCAALLPSNPHFPSWISIDFCAMLFVLDILFRTSSVV